MTRDDAVPEDPVTREVAAPATGKVVPLVTARDVRRAQGPEGPAILVAAARVVDPAVAAERAEQPATGRTAVNAASVTVLEVRIGATTGVTTGADSAQRVAVTTGAVLSVGTIAVTIGGVRFVVMTVGMTGVTTVGMIATPAPRVPGRNGVRRLVMARAVRSGVRAMSAGSVVTTDVMTVVEIAAVRVGRIGPVAAPAGRTAPNTGAVPG